jgi:hypothetical protein
MKFLGTNCMNSPSFLRYYHNNGLRGSLISHTQNALLPKLAKKLWLGMSLSAIPKLRANQRPDRRHCGASPISIPHPNCVAHKYPDFRHCAIDGRIDCCRSRWRDRLLEMVVYQVRGCISARLDPVTMRRNPLSMSHRLILSQMNQNKAPTRRNQ